RELRARTLVWNQAHLRRILREYETHHNQHRPHRSPDAAAPLKPLTEPVDLDQYRVRRHTPVRAARDAEVRTQIIARLQEKITGSDQLSPRKRAELAGALKTKPTFNRFLRATPSGKLRINRRA